MAERKAAAPVAGELVDGSGRFDVSDRRGDVIVINFWASWCGPCVAEAADLEQTYQATKSAKVTFLGVNTRDGRDDAASFIRNHRSTYPNVFDPAGKLAMGFAVAPTSIPSTLVIDRNGRLAAVAFGAVVRASLEPVVSQIAAEVG